jgi:hypothetical protein
MLMIIAARKKRIDVATLPYVVLDAVCNDLRHPNPGEALDLLVF